MKKKKYIVLISLTLIILSIILEKLRLNEFSNGLLIAAAVVASYHIVKNAINALRYKIVGIEALVSIAVIGAIFIGEYFESAVVSFLFVFGSYLEAITLMRTRNSIKELLNLVPLTVRVLRDNEEVIIDPSKVVKGDQVIIKSGEKVAIDGVIRSGSANINQAAITGESIPVSKTVDEEVFSGTIVESGYLVVEAVKVGNDTTFAKILELVEEAQSSKAKSQKFIEKFAHYYTPGIILLSVIVYMITRDIELTLTLLVISCPGAMVISAPVSIIAGIGNGAKNGILIKGGEHLEKAGKVDIVCFDKTGTLTIGKPVVTNLFSVDGDIKTLLYKASQVEKASEHHLGHAIVSKANQYFNEIEVCSNIEVIPGKGIKGEFKGEIILVGNIKMAHEFNINIPEEILTYIENEENKAVTAVIVFSNHKILGVISIADDIRSDALGIVKKLKKVGVKKVIMLTGDNEKTAKIISEKLNIDEYYANLLPAQKLEIIKKLKENNVVAMVGDGINDAPSLVTSDLGISIGGSTDVAIESSDVVLMSGKLDKLPHALKLSKATVLNMRQNLYFSVFVVLSLLIGVLTKNVFMSIGMLIHEISVVLVIINAIRLTKYKHQYK